MISSIISNETFCSVSINKHQKRLIKQAIKLESANWQKNYEQLLKTCKKSNSHRIDVNEAGRVYLDSIEQKGFSTTLYNLFNTLKTFKMLEDLKGII